LGSATKRLKESDLVVTQPSNNFGRLTEFGNPNLTVWKSKNNRNPSRALHFQIKGFLYLEFSKC
jgi:hypothetical protein